MIPEVYTPTSGAKTIAWSRAAPWGGLAVVVPGPTKHVGLRKAPANRPHEVGEASNE